MIDKLKAEVFDILKNQDILKIKYTQLEKLKQEKLAKLAEEEKCQSSKSDTKADSSAQKSDTPKS